MDGTFCAICRVSKSRVAWNMVPTRQTMAQALKPAARGWMISSTPAKPAMMASQRCSAMRSCKNSTANTIITSGAARLMAVALPRGKWKSELR